MNCLCCINTNSISDFSHLIGYYHKGYEQEEEGGRHRDQAEDRREEEEGWVQEESFVKAV